MSNIYLSREKGLNPSLAICPRCGKENGEIVLAGDARKYKCPDCGAVSISSPMHRRQLTCPRCQYKGDNWERLGVFDGERERAASSLCKDCARADALCQAEVVRGGVFWRCRDCGSAGAVKADHPLAVDVRKRLNVPAPEPCGVEFDKDHYCPVCSKDRVQE